MAGGIGPVLQMPNGLSTGSVVVQVPGKFARRSWKKATLIQVLLRDQRRIQEMRATMSFLKFICTNRTKGEFVHKDPTHELNTPGHRGSATANGVFSQQSTLTRRNLFLRLTQD